MGSGGRRRTGLILIVLILVVVSIIMLAALSFSLARGKRTTTLFCVPEVVLAFGNRRQELRPLTCGRELAGGFVRNVEVS